MVLDTSNALSWVVDFMDFIVPVQIESSEETDDLHRMIRVP